MKNVHVKVDEKDCLQVTSFGTEDISEDAHWGKGIREAYILHYVLSGEGYYNDCPVKEGQGFLIIPGKVHWYRSSAEKPLKYFWVVLCGTDAERVQKQYIPADENGIFSYDFKEELKSFCHNFFSTDKTIMHAKAKGIFWLLMSYHQKDQQIAGNKYVEAAKKYMQQNIYRALSICEIARTLHISDRYLYNLFVKYEGMSPKQYLSKLKLQKACNLLRNTAMPITEIAVSVGCMDVLTFSRFFRDKMGISPSVFREKRR